MILDPGNEFKVGYLAIQVPLVSTSTSHIIPYIHVHII